MKFPKISYAKTLTTLLAFIVLFASAYVGILSLYPKLFLMFSSRNIPEIESYAKTNKPSSDDMDSGTRFDDENSLIIPSLNLNELIHQGDESALELGIWQKFPERSNPILGGNFILTGHRFNFGLTPQSTLRKSPLYNVDELEIGDEIVVRWNDQYYKYKISKVFKVKPTQVEVESDTLEHQLTIYTCTLKGSYDGRVVIIAKPEFEVVKKLRI